MRRLLLLPLLLIAPLAYAQRDAGALSDAEVEEIRENAIMPDQRVITFQKALEARIKRIEDVLKEKPRPGRADDIHQYMKQFTAIADELDDNLDDYSARHADIRKPLPKLLAATERWATVLKTPPDNASYSLSRKLALEAVDDLHQAAKQLIDEQKEWFAAHPPPKPRDDKSREPIVIP